MARAPRYDPTADLPYPKVRPVVRGTEVRGGVRLQFPKPVRVKSARLLREYASRHPFCEVQGCKVRPCPEPHHLVSRQRGRDDRAHNLLRLCLDMHLQWHRWGGKRWLVVYRERLEPEALAKVRAALRLEGTS